MMRAANKSKTMRARGSDALVRVVQHPRGSLRDVSKTTLRAMLRALLRMDDAVALRGLRAAIGVELTVRGLEQVHAFEPALVMMPMRAEAACISN